MRVVKDILQILRDDNGDEINFENEIEETTRW